MAGNEGATRREEGLGMDGWVDRVRKASEIARRGRGAGQRKTGRKGALVVATEVLFVRWIEMETRVMLISRVRIVLRILHFYLIQPHVVCTIS